MTNYTSTLKFDELDADILLLIFDFCSLNDVVALKRVCHYLNCVINDSYLVFRKSKRVLVSNQSTKTVLNRSYAVLNPAEKCRISKNWINGSYKETVYRFKNKYMPWLVLHRDVLWLSQKNTITAYPRTKSGIDFKNPTVSLSIEATSGADVSRFDLNSSILICGDRDDGIWGFDPSNGKRLFSKRHAHMSDVSAVALCGNLIVSSSKDGVAKLWKISDDRTNCTEISKKFMFSRIWCTAVNPMNNLVCCGVARSPSNPLSISIFDFNTKKEHTIYADKGDYQGVVLDVVWETPSTVLTCGSSSCVKLYDLRCNKVVLTWSDPFDTAGYCLATDNSYSVLCGVAMHNRIQLYDKRTCSSVQSFYCNQKMSSPVYSTNFDATHLFSILDSSLSIMDFKGYNNVSKNYSQFYNWIQVKNGT
ncbi:unnamed protein product [Bemisia tabaci]|uniref:F-box domain-containing protein n=1 Tax=Bemisia tabaci TaxID=7038 RepID=A0A9P0ACM7_BEMTA|nr:PREDICTED: F-box/WD repeat-containing protein 4 [Bemisia tabaci]CAH0391549.1 unnamed protein product [Bemisia tabaci]